MGLKHGGEKRGFHSRDVLTQYAFPEYDTSAGYRVIPEGLVWRKIGEKFKTRYISVRTIVRIHLRRRPIP